MRGSSSRGVDHVAGGRDLGRRVVDRAASIDGGARLAQRPCQRGRHRAPHRRAAERRVPAGVALFDARHGRQSSALDRLSPDARIAIAELEKIAAATPSQTALADVGVAYLVAGDVDRSIASLTEATELGSSAAPWSDLSAAYLTKAERVPARNVEYLSRALEAATRALAISPSNEARFNQALALDRLSRFVGLTAPWSDYLHVERDPAWIDAAKRHITDDAAGVEPRTLWDARERELRVPPEPAGCVIRGRIGARLSRSGARPPRTADARGLVTRCPARRFGSRGGCDRPGRASGGGIRTRDRRRDGAQGGRRDAERRRGAGPRASRLRRRARAI